MEDVMEEILLRFPPDEPALLVRASLVCRPWRRLLADPAFGRRYRAFHRTPPTLGFFRGNYLYSTTPRFFPATATPAPFSTPSFGRSSWWVLGCRPWWVLDCRHGRALLRIGDPYGLVVWDPITGDQAHLPGRPAHPEIYRNAAVLCAVDGCDHLACHGGPFLVVRTGAWSTPAKIVLSSGSDVAMNPSALVGKTLYFSLVRGSSVLLKYSLDGHALLVIDAPFRYMENKMALMTAEDGSLRFALLDGLIGFGLQLWSLRAARNGVAEWTRHTVIKLRTMLSAAVGDPSSMLDVLGGFPEGADTIIVRTHIGVYIVELKSGRVRKVCESNDLYGMVPFVSFYTPDLAYARLQPAIED
ncbi:hypothetical protein ACP70R_015129 [Stipagrostis hirtigluma subsp. patula]